MKRLAFFAIALLGGACGAPAEPAHPAIAHDAESAPSALASPTPSAQASLAVAPSAKAALPAPSAAPEVVPEPERVDLPPEIDDIIAAKDRPGEDRKLDFGRQPGATLAFYGIAPGEHVAELGAGDGYFTELLARAVVPNGKVFAENPKAASDGAAGVVFTSRLTRPPMKDVVVRVDREIDSPLPPEAKDLDVVFVAFFYHDLYWMKVDRAALNKAIFAALKPGGTYAVMDHAARPGQGTTVVKTLHRIEKSEVVRDVTAAGFVLDAESTFLRNPRDTKEWNTSGTENHGTSDRFVLRFKKPN